MTFHAVSCRIIADCGNSGYLGRGLRRTFSSLCPISSVRVRSRTHVGLDPDRLLSRMRAKHVFLPSRPPGWEATIAGDPALSPLLARIHLPPGSFPSHLLPFLQVMHASSWPAFRSSSCPTTRSCARLSTLSHPSSTSRTDRLPGDSTKRPSLEASLTYVVLALRSPLSRSRVARTLTHRSSPYVPHQMVTDRCVPCTSSKSRVG